MHQNIQKNLNGQTDRQTERLKIKCPFNLMVGRTNRWTNKWINRCIDGWPDGHWPDGQMEQWTHRRIDKPMDRQLDQPKIGLCSHVARSMQFRYYCKRFTITCSAILFCPHFFAWFACRGFSGNYILLRPNVTKSNWTNFFTCTKARIRFSIIDIIVLILAVVGFILMVVLLI